jgi:16S rRNA (cytidine1402-2'-O)-methyltransferase
MISKSVSMYLFRSLIQPPSLFFAPKPRYTLAVATLYIIGSPLGNLGDLSFRALEVLKTTALLACEDTRRTVKLLNHYGIKVKLLSCRSQNEDAAAEKVIALLDQGLSAAYMSDAGTPGVSDPGAVLVRRTCAAGHEVIPIPGPSAFASLVSVAGAQDKTVAFEGFLSPRDSRRRTRLRELMEGAAACVLYESPFRILKLLGDLVDIDGDRYICIGREMTKIHEEYLRGPAARVLEQLAARTEQKGEFSVYVTGKKKSDMVQ